MKSLMCIFYFFFSIWFYPWLFYITNAAWREWYSFPIVFTGICSAVFSLILTAIFLSDEPKK
jgi:hypothetical protein